MIWHFLTIAGSNRRKPTEPKNSRATTAKLNVWRKAENGRTWFNRKFNLVQPGANLGARLPIAAPNAVDPDELRIFSFLHLSRWDCGFNLGWFGMWVWSAVEASMFRLICSACSAMTPQERLLKFYGSVRAERVSAEASQSNSFLRMFPFFLISPNFCKRKSLCSYQISVTLCFFESLTCFKTAVWNKWKLKMKLGRYTIHKLLIFLIWWVIATRNQSNHRNHRIIIHNNNC